MLRKTPSQRHLTPASFRKDVKHHCNIEGKKPCPWLIVPQSQTSHPTMEVLRTCFSFTSLKTQSKRSMLTYKTSWHILKPGRAFCLHHHTGTAGCFVIPELQHCNHLLKTPHSSIISIRQPSAPRNIPLETAASACWALRTVVFH